MDNEWIKKGEDGKSPQKDKRDTQEGHEGTEEPENLGKASR